MVSTIFLHNDKFADVLLKLLHDSSFSYRKLTISEFDKIKKSKKIIVISIVDSRNAHDLNEQFLLNKLSRDKNFIFIGFRFNGYLSSIGPIVEKDGPCLNCIKTAIEKFNSIGYSSNNAKEIKVLGETMLFHLIKSIFNNVPYPQSTVINIYGESPKIHYDYAFQAPYCEVCFNVK